jgi:hypothetical protein
MQLLNSQNVGCTVQFQLPDVRCGDETDPELTGS